MIPESIRDNVPSYVLGELGQSDLAVFEIEMMRSAELQREVRQCAETLGMLAARSAPPESPPAGLWNAIEARVRAENGVTPFLPVPRVAPVMPMPRRSSRGLWAWPAAAAVLLLLNIVQWKARDTGDGLDRQVEIASDASANPDPDIRDDSRSANLATFSGGESAVARDDHERATSERPGNIPSARERILADEYRKLAAEYDGLVDLISPLIGTGALQLDERGVWTMEMGTRLNVAPGAVLGLWNRVRDLVPENGVAMLPDRWRMPGGIALDPNAWFAGSGSVASPGMESDGPVTPYALAVINGEEGLGYLDLYNLPLVPTGQELRIWLEGEVGAGYTSVGVVPPVLSGASAGLVFRVPPTVGSARRVLITMEPTGGSGQPSGPVVIDGP